MFPHSINVGPLPIEPMGLAWALGFLLGLWLAVHRAKKAGIPSNLVVNLFVLILFSSLIGAKLFFVVFHWRAVAANWNDFLAMKMSGSGVFGAVALSIFSVLFYLRTKRQNVWPVLDVIAPSLLGLAVGLGRLGCFATGCCFGRPTESAIGVVFPLDSPAGAAFPGLALIPTQLFAAAKGFLLAAVGIWIDRRKEFSGQTFLSMLFLYSLGRFCIDFYRHYENEMLLFPIGNYFVTITQLISLIVASIAGVTWFHLKSKRPLAALPGKEIGARRQVGIFTTLPVSVGIRKLFGV